MSPPGESIRLDFVLESVDNPHPVMLMRALQFRRAARAARRDPAETEIVTFWIGYRDAMCDATGEKPEAIEAWMDRHDDVDTDALREAHDGQQAAPVTIGRKPQ